MNHSEGKISFNRRKANSATLKLTTETSTYKQNTFSKFLMGAGAINHFQTSYFRGYRAREFILWKFMVPLAQILA